MECRISYLIAAGLIIPLTLAGCLKSVDLHVDQLPNGQVHISVSRGKENMCIERIDIRNVKLPEGSGIELIVNDIEKDCMYHVTIPDNNAPYKIYGNYDFRKGNTYEIVVSGPGFLESTMFTQK